MVWREVSFMLLNRKIKGGILIYALFISAIFALLLQFYLERVVAMKHQQLAQISSSQAYLIADLTRDLATDKDGQVTFEQGRADYFHQKGQLKVKVKLVNGEDFDYIFENTKNSAESMSSTVR